VFQEIVLTVIVRYTRKHEFYQKKKVTKINVFKTRVLNAKASNNTFGPSLG